MQQLQCDLLAIGFTVVGEQPRHFQYGWLIVEIDENETHHYAALWTEGIPDVKVQIELSKSGDDCWFCDGGRVKGVWYRRDAEAVLRVFKKRVDMWVKSMPNCPRYQSVQLQ